MLKGAGSGGGAASGITIGTSVITGGTNTRVLYDNNGVIGEAASLLINSTAGQGPSIVAGTATTDVAALSVTRTNNNAAVATGVKFTFTDTTSAAGFEAFGIYGGAAGTTQLLSVNKVGTISAGALVLGSALTSVTNSAYITAGFLALDGSNGVVIKKNNATVLGITDAVVQVDTTGGLLQLGGTIGSGDTSFSRLSAGVIGVGTGAAGSIAGGIQLASVGLNAGHIALSATAPTVASGGCTSPTAVTSNGTAAFSVGVGTSCSGSQPLVFTLPAATTGWQCNARNATNPGTSAPRQSSAASTTSVTITNYGATTGLAGAWSDADVVVVSCLGY